MHSCLVIELSVFQRACLTLLCPTASWNTMWWLFLIITYKWNYRNFIIGRHSCEGFLLNSNWVDPHMHVIQILMQKDTLLIWATLSPESLHKEMEEKRFALCLCALALITSLFLVYTEQPWVIIQVASHEEKWRRSSFLDQLQWGETGRGLLGPNISSLKWPLLAP